MVNVDSPWLQTPMFQWKCVARFCAAFQGVWIFGWVGFLLLLHCFGFCFVCLFFIAAFHAVIERSPFFIILLFSLP